MSTYAGITFREEGTGGGCTADVAKVEGGTIVLTDGNLGTDYAWAMEQGEPIVAAFFPGTMWDDGEDAPLNAEGAATPDAAVEALLRKVAGR